MISCGVGTPSRDFTIEDLFSSRMMSMHSSTHSSQMNTVGPAISLRTSCWLLPQKEQYSVFLESPPPLLTLLISQSFRYLQTPAGAGGQVPGHSKPKPAGAPFDPISHLSGLIRQSWYYPDLSDATMLRTGTLH